MAGDGRQPSEPVENFIDEWEKEDLGGQITVVYCSTIKSASSFLGSKSILGKILFQ